MPRAPPPAIAAYLAKQSRKNRAALRKLRTRILAALPGAVERISYQIPAFATKDGGVVVWMAGFPKHCSFFGAYAGAKIAREMQEPGGPFVVKGTTIQFDPERGVPATLVKRIVRARVAATSKKAAKKPARTRAAPRTGDADRR